MKQEAKRIVNELDMLRRNGVDITKNIVMDIANHNSYWYVVFKNTNDFDDSMNELMAEAM